MYCTQFSVSHQKRQLEINGHCKSVSLFKLQLGRKMSSRHLGDQSWLMENNEKFRARIRHPISGHLSGPNNADKLLTPGQLLRSIPFSKVQHRFIHHRSNVSHHHKVRLNFKVIEGGVNIVGIWEKSPGEFILYTTVIVCLSVHIHYIGCSLTRCQIGCQTYHKTYLPPCSPFILVFLA